MGVSPHSLSKSSRDFSVIWDSDNLALDLHDELEGECAVNPDNAKPAKIPYAPSQAEIDEHEVTHYPWRAWCSCCVRGAAFNDPHYRVQGRKLTRPTISVDYSFLSSRGQETESTIPILNIKDLVTKRGCMEVVPRKGNSEYAAEVLTEFIKASGYNNLSIKSDQEPAIASLITVGSQADIKTEKSPVGESSSNGKIDSQISRNTAFVRVLKHCLESHIKERVEADWSIVP